MPRKSSYKRRSQHKSRGRFPKSRRRQKRRSSPRSKYRSAALSDQASVLPVGTLCHYTTYDGSEVDAVVEEVHYDDSFSPYYTITIDGKERQTIRNKLFPVDDRAAAVLTELKTTKLRPEDDPNEPPFSDFGYDADIGALLVLQDELEKKRVAEVLRMVADREIIELIQNEPSYIQEFIIRIYNVFMENSNFSRKPKFELGFIQNSVELLTSNAKYNNWKQQLDSMLGNDQTTKNKILQIVFEFRDYLNAQKYKEREVLRMVADREIKELIKKEPSNIQEFIRRIHKVFMENDNFSRKPNFELGFIQNSVELLTSNAELRDWKQQLDSMLKNDQTTKDKIMQIVFEFRGRAEKTAYKQKNARIRAENNERRKRLDDAIAAIGTGSSSGR